MNSQPPNKLATTSLTLAVLGWIIYLLQWCFDLTIGLVLTAVTGGTAAACGTVLDVLPFILWVAGIVCGHRALTQIKEGNGSSRGRAITGLVLNYFGLFFILIFLAAVVLLLVTGIHAGWLEKIFPFLYR